MKKLILALLLLAPAAARSAPSRESYLHFMNGVLLERKGSYDSALGEYKKTMLLDPGSVFVYKQALNLALHMGRVGEASSWADYVVKVDSSSSDNWALYGNVQWAKGDLKAAVEAFEKASSLDPENAEPVYQLASLHSSKEPEKSISYLRRYLELKPDDAPEVHYQMALLHNALGRKEEARKSLLESVSRDSLYLQPRYMLASLYEASSDTAAALGQYLELLSLDGKNTELVNRIGEIYAGPAANDPAEAEKYFRRAWDMDKGNPVASFWLAVFSESRGDFASAASYMSASRELKSNPGNMLRLGYYLTQSGRYPDAITLLEEANKKWPENNEIAYFLALGYDDTKRPQKAVELLRLVVFRAPKSLEARMQLGIISEREGDMATAEENFRAILAADPRNATVKNYLGYSLADRGLQLEEAERLISEAVAAEPGNGAFLDSMAWVAFKRGRTAEARGWIEKALAAMDTDGVVWDHAGDIAAAGGDRETAWLAWKHAWLMDAKKRPSVSAKLAAAGRELPPGVLAALSARFVKAYAPWEEGFSSFAKVTASVRGRKIKLDAVVKYAPGELVLTVTGPLMAPVWEARVAGDSVVMQPLNLEGVDEKAFAYWAGLAARELYAYFSAGWAGEAPLSGGPRELRAGPRAVGLDEGGSFPLSWESKAAPKMELSFSGQFFRNYYSLPGIVEIKVPFVSVRLELDKASLKLEGRNRLFPLK